MIIITFNFFKQYFTQALVLYFKIKRFVIKTISQLQF